MTEISTTFSLDLPPRQARSVGRWMYFYDTTGSTQDLALASHQDGAVFVADAQTAGRGRRRTPWQSRPGLGLWLSVALEGAPEGLQFAGALAVRDACQPEVHLQLKWPNDLMLAGHKVAGVLVEYRDGWSALGIGINVHHTPDDFAELGETPAGSLEQLGGLSWDRAALLHRLLESLDHQVTQLRNGGLRAIRDEWAKACEVIGQPIAREGISGMVLEMEDDGALRVKTATGIVRLGHGAAVSLEESAS